MTTRFERLQELNGLLTDYAEALTPEAVTLPKAKDALRRVYDLQSRTSREIHSLLHEDDLPMSVPRPGRQPDPLLHPFKNAIVESERSARGGIGQILADPVFTEHFDRLYTILGPNTGFPDDDDPPVTQSGSPGR